MERAAQGRAAGVRFGAGSVPVKDRFEQKGRAKRKNECSVEPKKNAASAGALRRVEQKNEGEAAIRQQSELGRFLRRRVRGFAIAVEPLARGLGHPVAQHVAELRAVGFALLAQFIESFGIGRQFFHRRDIRFRRVGIPRRFGLASGGQNGRQQEWDDLLHGINSSGGSGLLPRMALGVSCDSMVCTRSIKRVSSSDGSPSRRSK